MNIYCQSYLDQLKEISLQNKYLNWYISLCQHASSRFNTRKQAIKEMGYCEGHHALPKSFNVGGEKDICNLVYFTAREHVIAHKLLTKFTTEKLKSKMIYAYWALVNFDKSGGKKIINSRDYAIAKYWMISEKSKPTGKPAWNSGLTN
jgi:hypothetical protein